MDALAFRPTLEVRHPAPVHALRQPPLPADRVKELPEPAHELRKQVREPRKQIGGQTDSVYLIDSIPYAVLTRQELLILCQVARGRKNSWIARHLKIGRRTVETYRERTNTKIQAAWKCPWMGVAVVTQYAIWHGLIVSSPTSIGAVNKDNVLKYLKMISEERHRRKYFAERAEIINTLNQTGA